MHGSTAPADILSIILLCGLMGMVGQGVRAAVGLKNAGALASTTPSQQSQFSAAYFVLSLMIGFIAGVVAGLASKMTSTPTDFSDPAVLLGLAGSGYIGADLIENSLSLFIPAGGAAQQPAGSAGPTKSAPSVSAQPIVDTITAPPQGAPLAAALSIVLPRVDATLWTPALMAAFRKYDLYNAKRVAAAIGQFAVESGASFQELTESLDYSANRLHEVFTEFFPTVQDAVPYVGHPEMIANRIYANKIGNGDLNSGDGFRFRGRGLIQITGRSNYAEFGATIGKSAEDSAAYCETIEGAAMSGCWFLNSRGCLPLADAWQLSALTAKVNTASLGVSQRLKYANDMLKHLGG